ncbi:MAG TPA: hypothetical protein VMB80_11065 [Candidatus Acidoferrum sp.]|nr:hypothetical protein [Candidatus Acidoferrum sp.]
MSSLKTFIRESPEVRHRFSELFPKCALTIRPLIVVPPVKYSAQKASLIGTAFDYLLRFYLQRLNTPVIKARRWFAENAIEILAEDAEWEIRSRHETSAENAAKARKLVTTAKHHLAEYLDSGAISDNLIRSALALATLDPIARSGRGDEMIGVFNTDDVLDVRRLIQAVDDSLFKATRLCLLNPTFNESPDFALGADADLVIDDAIVEIKTLQEFRLTRSDLDQLIGYFLLNELVGFSEVAPKPMVTKVGVYFSRHACLHMIPIRRFIDENTLAELLPWFKQIVADYSPQDLDWKPRSNSQ